MPSGVYPRPTRQERLLAKIVIDRKTKCWNWCAYRDDDGYGKLRGRYAHLIAYELYIGPVPKGLVVDHTCSNRACVNPKHLEAVTQRINIARSKNHVARKMRQTKCIRRHPLSGDNLYRTPDGRRQCRKCGRLRERKHRSAKRA